MNTESNEPIPNPIAEMDQSLATLRTVARVMWTYHSALVSVGFTAEQSLSLTIAYQTGLQQKA
jgi:hypothetical protein